MIRKLRAQQFKSWRDTGAMRFAPITGLFGTNSSGKTAILQLLLMLKQTVESTDRQRVLNTGDDRTYVDLGTFYDIVHAHTVPGHIDIAIEWNLPEPLRVIDPDAPRRRVLFAIPALEFATRITGTNQSISVDRFRYAFQTGSADALRSYTFGMDQRLSVNGQGRPEYDLRAEGYDLKRSRGRPAALPPPVKCYGFPDQVNAYYQNAGFLADLVLAFEELFNGMFYLGPLREYPQRDYVWGGERPQDVGRRGELAVSAMLASREQPSIKIGEGRRPTKTVEARVAMWLRKLGLIHDFSLRAIAENRKSYEVRVKRAQRSSEVLITDVGFGVSQILPVLVLCYYAPEGSTIILEQPEIHLHPRIQAGLADVFIDAVNSRNIQIIVESHSEHLLRRLQRHIAEEALSRDQAALYFCNTNNQGVSQLQELELDPYGNITNWPKDFFGDEMGDLLAMTEAAIERQQRESNP
jgi:predicted ATPase